MSQSNRPRHEKPMQAKNIEISGFGPITKPIDIPGFGTEEYNNQSKDAQQQKENAKEKPMEAKFLEMEGFGPNTRRKDTSAYGRAFMPWEPAPDGPRPIMLANTLSTSRRKDRDWIMLPYGGMSRRDAPVDEDGQDKRNGYCTAREDGEDPIMAGPSNAEPTLDRTSTSGPSPTGEEPACAEENPGASRRGRVPSISLSFILGRRSVPKADD